VRRFLEEKLENHPKIQFNSLGPSPFHVDFFLIGVKNRDEESVSAMPRSGYDMLVVKAAFHREPLRSFTDRYEDILSCYYFITWRKNFLFRSSSKIIDLVMSLTKVTGSRWPVVNFRAMGKRERIISSIYVSLLHDKMLRISIDEFVNEGKRSQSIVAENALYHFIEDVLSELPVVPTAEIQKVVDIVEGRRQKFLDNSSTVVAGLLGAILGALLAFAFTTIGNDQQRSGPIPTLPQQSGAPPSSDSASGQPRP
jgi:hypothetical protein